MATSMLYDFVFDPKYAKSVTLPIDVKLNGTTIGQVTKITERKGTYYGVIKVNSDSAQKFLQAYMLQHRSEVTFRGQ